MPVIGEQAVNHELAKALAGMNPRWEGLVLAEQTGVLDSAGKRPDIVLLTNPPIVLETEFAPARGAEGDAKARLGEHTLSPKRQVENAFAVRLPEAWKDSAPDRLATDILSGSLEYCIWSRSGEEHRRWPEAGWLASGLGGLADRIERVTLSEDLINACLEELETSIDSAACIMIESHRNQPDTLKKVAAALHQRPDVDHMEQIFRMAMAIVSNAITFHQIISGSSEVDDIEQLKNEDGNVPRSSLIREWGRIISEVNYWPIFRPAKDILKVVTPTTSTEILGNLVASTEFVIKKDVMGSQDLYGSLYQRMIVDRKFLATFYTRPSAAVLLSELAVGMVQGFDWSSPQDMERFRLADLACGTGTLLASAYQAVLGRHRRAGGNDESVHPAMVENSVIGADIMPAAAHLTTSMLSSIFPSQTFTRTQIRYVPYGKEKDREPEVGSLDFIDRQHGVDLFQAESEDTVPVAHEDGTGEGSGDEIAEGTQAGFSLKHDSVDLMIMNPPFTRPTNHAAIRQDVPVPSFGGLGTSTDEQKFMAARLSKLRKAMQRYLEGAQVAPAGHGNAGLASNFIDLAHIKLSEGGVLALVLPQAIAAGSSWENARSFISKLYSDVTVISISDQTERGHRSFSADTEMGEVLLLARKRGSGATGSGSEITWVNINRAPRSSLQAAVLADEIRKASPETGRIERIKVGETALGWVCRSEGWENGYAGIVDPDLAQAVSALSGGKLAGPVFDTDYSLPIVPLGTLGSRGLLDRDINGKDGNAYRGPFDIESIASGTVPTRPALWAHDSASQTRLVLAPDSEAVTRSGMSEKAAEVWKTATRLHFARDFGLSANPVGCCLTEKPTLGGRAWPNFKLNQEGLEEAMALWANTSLGIMLYWFAASRQQGGRAILTISRLEDLPVLDVSSLGKEQLKKAMKLWDGISKEDFLPANEAYRDPVRQKLDEAIIFEVLGLPKSVLDSVELLRLKWCNEPSVHGGKSTAPEKTAGLIL